MSAWMKELARLLAELLEYPLEYQGGACERIDMLRARLHSRLRVERPGPEEGAAVAKADAALAEMKKRYKNASLLELQEAHAATFDFMPECSLFMSWHKYGDSPKQGRALAALCELYRDYGYSLNVANLPDYLPVMLEFMSAAPDQATAVLLDGFAAELRALASRISAAKNVYAQAGLCLAALTEALAGPAAPEVADTAPKTPNAASAHASPTARLKGGRPCTAG